jgi:hypothetical protein
MCYSIGEKMRNTVIQMLFVVFIFSIFSFAANDSLYEMDGSAFNERDKTKGPKALIKVKRSIDIKKDSVRAEPRSVSYTAQDTLHISLKDSVHWYEMEKNTAYSICVDDSKGGIWKVKDFSYNKETDNCIQLYSGNYVKSGKIQYATKMGNGYTFHLLIGMKYIDLRGKRHLLGYFGPEFRRKRNVFYLDPQSDFENRIYPDSLKYKNIDKILAVDEYKVTECEFIQTLWDSIPEQEIASLSKNQFFWILKKKSLNKNDFCDAHDSAAVLISPYFSLIYANKRSLRDGLNPVYTFEESNGWKSMKIYEDGSFGIRKKTFFPSEENDLKFVIVHIDKSANGYRLPYYDEWMALARGGEANREYVWGNESDSALASQYAWFGIRDPEDPYTKRNPKNHFDRSSLEHSCGDWMQKSRPVGMLKPNAYGLYDMAGLVCESVMLPGKSIFDDEILACKGGFLPDSLKSLNLGAHCDYKSTNDFIYHGLRLVRRIR